MKKKIFPFLSITLILLLILNPWPVYITVSFRSPYHRGAYTGKYPLPWEGGISADAIWGGDMKRGKGKTKKEENMKEKEKRLKIKGN